MITIGARSGPFKLTREERSRLESIVAAAAAGTLAVMPGTLRNERVAFLGVFRPGTKKRAPSFFPVAVILRPGDLDHARDLELCPLGERVETFTIDKRG